MLVLRTFVACAFILRVGGAPLLQPPVQAATTYVQPSLDSFYDKPLGLDKLRPGDIIRERLVPTNIAGTRSVYQVLYATLDTMGRMDATVTTLYAPETPAPGPPKILSLQLPQDSAARDCAISYDILSQVVGSPTNSTGQNAFTITITASMYQGHYIAAPDFEGSRGAFSVGKTEGHALLDGLRALLKHKKTLPDPTGHSIILSGYSGGAHASAWGAQLASTYAPELNITGMAAGGLPVDPGSILISLNKGPFAGFAAGGLGAFLGSYDDLNDYARSILTPEGAAAISTIQAYACVPQLLEDFAFKDFFSWMTVSREELLSNPIVAQRLGENKLGMPGTPVPKFPQYIYSGVLDEIIPNSGVTAHVDDQCARGAQIEYTTDMLAEHVLEQYVQFLISYEWVVNTFNGKTPITGACQRKNNAVSPMPDVTSDVTRKLVGPAAVERLLAILK